MSATVGPCEATPGDMSVFIFVNRLLVASAVRGCLSGAGDVSIGIAPRLGGLGTLSAHAQREKHEERKKYLFFHTLSCLL